MLLRSNLSSSSKSLSCWYSCISRCACKREQMVKSILLNSDDQFRAKFDFQILRSHLHCLLNFCEQLLGITHRSTTAPPTQPPTRDPTLPRLMKPMKPPIMSKNPYGNERQKAYILKLASCFTLSASFYFMINLWDIISK